MRNSLKRSRRALALSALLGPTALLGCSDGDAPNSETPAGSLSLSLTVEGQRVERVQLAVSSESLTPPVERTRTLDVSDPRAAVAATEYGLPAATYKVALSAQLADDPSTPRDERTIACAGEVSGVVVTAGSITDVNDLVLLCGEGGSRLQTAGGLSVRAEVAVDLTPACGDLVQELHIGPQQTTVGQSVALTALADPGVTVAWTAPAGTIAPDGSSYTCPDVAGTYAVTATFTRDPECRRTVTREVVCRSAYQGECGALPESFVLGGSCELPSPCQVTQDGCTWQASCRGQKLSGEVQGSTVSFIDAAGQRCTGSLADGSFSGSCEGSAGASCTFSANTQSTPGAYCAPLPRVVSGVTSCGKSLGTCEVIQDGCDYQASCNGGANLAYGTITGDSLRWDTVLDGKNFRCTGDLVNGAVAGNCTQRGAGSATPETCEDFALVAPPDGTGGSCEATLPSGGFALAGCGFDDLCFAAQRNCAWQVACGERVFSGIATSSNAFTWQTPEGRRCSASVTDGRFVGSCEGGGESCSFAPVERTSDASCFQLPARVSTGGCGAFWDCDVVQSGCDFQARCQGGAFSIAGTATTSGISFPGLNDYTCNADLAPDGSRLLGQCTRQNADGSISQCRDLTAQQGARLVIDWD